MVNKVEGIAALIDRRLGLTDTVEELSHQLVDLTAEIKQIDVLIKEYSDGLRRRVH